jgi:hypothetical protein
MKLCCLAVTLALLLPATVSAQTCWFFDGFAWGRNVVPPTSSHAAADISSYFDSCELCPSPGWPDDRLTFNLSVRDDAQLEGTPLYVDLRSGSPGENGPLLQRIDLEGQSLPLAARLEFNPADCPALGDTLVYVVIGTSLFPDGEIRGRLVPRPPAAITRCTWGRVRSAYR